MLRPLPYVLQHKVDGMGKARLPCNGRELVTENFAGFFVVRTIIRDKLNHIVRLHFHDHCSYLLHNIANVICVWYYILCQGENNASIHGLTFNKY
jgi:hypothetical protein